jgi:hypothetical protein
LPSHPDTGPLFAEEPADDGCDEPSRSVAVKRALEGAHEQIAFGSVVVEAFGNHLLTPTLLVVSKGRQI